MRFLARFLRVVLATLISLMSLALIAQTPADAADGDLDTSFSTDGQLLNDYHASGEDGWRDAVFDANGNLIMAGWWNNNGQTNKHSWAMNRITGAGTALTPPNSTTTAAHTGSGVLERTPSKRSSFKMTAKSLRLGLPERSPPVQVATTSALLPGSPPTRTSTT